MLLIANRKSLDAVVGGNVGGLDSGGFGELGGGNFGSALEVATKMGRVFEAEIGGYFLYRGTLPQESLRGVKSQFIEPVLGSPAEDLLKLTLQGSKRYATK